MVLNMLSDCIIYVTAVAFMCFANKHIIIIINMHELLTLGVNQQSINPSINHNINCITLLYVYVFFLSFIYFFNCSYISVILLKLFLSAFFIELNKRLFVSICIS
jgi:hypothetical protein